MAGTATATHRRTTDGARHNVGTADRVVSGLLGAWMLTGRRKRRHGFGKVVAVASGVLLLRRAATAHSAVYEQLGVSSAALDEGAGITIERSVTVGREPREVYAFLRDLTNLPIVFTHLAEVTVGGDGVSHWTLKARPGNRTIQWDVRVLNDHPGEYISWTSLEGSSVQQSGSVHFRPVGQGSTDVHVKLRYRPPGGAWGFGLAKLLNSMTEMQVEEDLQRLKRLLESGGAGGGELRASGGTERATGGQRATGAEPLRPLNEPEPVVVRGWELDADASTQIAGAPVPKAELERVMAAVEGVDAARPVTAVDEDFGGGTER